MSIQPSPTESPPSRFNLLSFRQRVVIAFCVTLTVLLVDAFVLHYCFVGAKCQLWIEKFSAGSETGWSGAIIEFGRHAILVPLVAAVLTFRFGVPIRHLFGARKNFRVNLFRVLLVTLVLGVTIGVAAHNFWGLSLDSFADASVEDSKKLAELYKVYFWYSLFQHLFVTIPLVFCPVYALSYDLSRLSTSFHGLSDDIKDSQLEWADFKKKFSEFKASCLTISIRYIDVLAILALSICYELIWGFSTLTSNTIVVTQFCWFLTALSAVIPMFAWLWFNQAYVEILKRRGEEIDVEWNQGNNCQSFVFSLFTASPGGVVAILIFLSLLQKGLDHGLSVHFK